MWPCVCIWGSIYVCLKVSCWPSQCVDGQRALTPRQCEPCGAPPQTGGVLTRGWQVLSLRWLPLSGLDGWSPSLDLIWPWFLLFLEIKKIVRKGYSFYHPSFIWKKFHLIEELKGPYKEYQYTLLPAGNIINTIYVPPVSLLLSFENQRNHNTSYLSIMACFS